LFWRIERQHGEAYARKIFAQRGRPTTKADAKERRKWEVLDQLDRMQPKPNVRQFAKALAHSNRSLPKAEQKGLGGIDQHALEALIRVMRTERTEKRKAGEWYGPPWPEPAPKPFPTKFEMMAAHAVLKRPLE
jgi:thioredoxin-like negative regulator of GroEL